MEDADILYLQTLAKYLSKIKRNCEQLDANQKLRTFMFNIKTVPYCSDQHVLKAARLSFHILIIYIAVDLYVFKCATFIHNI